jgi:hypothetical protein
VNSNVSRLAEEALLDGLTMNVARFWFLLARITSCFFIELFVETLIEELSTNDIGAKSFEASPASFHASSFQANCILYSRLVCVA